MIECCVPAGCQCACHRFPGVFHFTACCDAPPMRGETVDSWEWLGSER